MNNPASHSGGCLCGQVRYTIMADPVGSRACWCRLCQYLAAGNATVNVLFPSDALTITGEVSVYESTADSGNQMKRTFCPKCGTQLFSYTDSRSHITVVRTGSLDEPELGAPQGIIWAKEAPSWAHFDPNLETMDGQPSPPPKPAD